MRTWLDATESPAEKSLKALPFGRVGPKQAKVRSTEHHGGVGLAGVMNLIIGGAMNIVKDIEEATNGLRPIFRAQFFVAR